MKAFIFTAGYGERLRPITDAMPKPLVPVVNVPALHWPLALLRRAGVSRVIMNLHHRPDDLVRYCEANNNFGFEISFSREDPILGTGGGLKKCEKELSGGDFLVLNGDVVMDLDLEALLAYHRERRAVATVVLYRHPDAAEIGPVGVRGDLVADFRNFLGTGINSGFVFTGAAALSPSIFSRLDRDFSSIVYTAYVDIIRHGALHYFVHGGFWHDIGTPESLYRVNMAMLEDLDDAGALLGTLAGKGISPVSQGALVEKGALVEGSVLGDGARVESGALVRGSVLLPGAAVEKGAVLDGALVFGDAVLYSEGTTERSAMKAGGGLAPSSL